MTGTPAAPVTLEELLGQWSLAAFVRDIWEQQPLYLAGQALRLVRLLEPAAIERDIERALGRDRPGRGRAFATFYTPAGELRELRLPDLTTLRFCRDQGMTIVAYDVEDPAGPIARLMVDIKTRLRLTAEPSVATFCSPIAEAGFREHYDAASIFAVQLAGRKRWQVSRRPAVAAPMSRLMLQRGAPPAAKDPEWLWRAATLPSELERIEVVLEPGDVLYVPPGCWHDVSAVEPSLHVSLAFSPVNTALLLSNLVNERLRRLPAWRTTLPASLPGAEPAGQLPPVVAAFLGERLRELKAWVDTLEPADLHAEWQAYVHRFAYPCSDVKLARTLELADRVAVACRSPLTFALGDDARTGEPQVIVFGDERSVSLSRAALPLVRELVQRRSFTAGAAGDWGMGWQAARPVLERLIGHRLLRLQDEDGDDR